MKLTASRIRPNAHGITGWALIVLGFVLGATGLAGPAMSGATVLGMVLLVAGGLLVASVLRIRSAGLAG